MSFNPPRRISFYPPAPTAARRIAARASAETATIVERLHDHIDGMQHPDPSTTRLRTALRYYLATPRQAELKTPENIASAYQSARLRNTCHGLMDAAATAVPKSSEQFLLLQEARFAMRLTQRMPHASDVANAFLRQGPSPTVRRDTLPMLQIFKTELAVLDFTQFDEATCAWLDRVGAAIADYEQAGLDHAAQMWHPEDLAEEGMRAAYQLKDTLNEKDRPVALSKSFEEARQAAATMAECRVYDFDLEEE